MTFLGSIPDIYGRKHSTVVVCLLPDRIVCYVVDIREESVCSLTTVKKENMT